MTADELELARLKQMEEMGYGFKPNPAGEQQTLDDLRRPLRQVTTEEPRQHHRSRASRSDEIN